MAETFWIARCDKAQKESFSRKDCNLGLEERRKRERESRKNAILKAARKLFFEKGFRSVTVESIARKADLSKGSIYLYYSSKEEIYSQILLKD
ncbi:MAG: helix-turn-helix domain-containing protein, partial [Pseudomonadota bacterium]